MHLISHHLCPYVQRAVIALIEKDVPHERTYIDLAAKPDWFVAASPLGRTPLLMTGGRVVFESQIIVEYIDEITPGTLHPGDPLERARHRSWIEFGSETLAVVGQFYNAATPEAFDEKRGALRSKFERIEAEIAGRFFGGAEFHIIDGVWATIFRYFDVFDHIADFGILTGLDKLAMWRAVVSQRPSVVAAVPDGYPHRLEAFLRNRDSHFKTLMPLSLEAA